MENLIRLDALEWFMRILAFSVGLILLIAFSMFSSLQILKIENVNAQVTVPKTYVQTVNDPYINSPYAWENFTTGLDPDSYARIENGVFNAYSKRVGADEWGDCIARQGYYPHLNRYCLDWDNKLIKPMVHYPYIPADIGGNQIILQATGKHSAPIWHGNWPPATKSPWGPTIGATIMLYFNVYVHDNINNVDKWLFNFHEPNPFAGPNMFVLEIFMCRWIVPSAETGLWLSVSPGWWPFEQFCTQTTHDNDLHMLTCPFDMPVNDQWYYFLYDVGNKLRDDAVNRIEAWSWDYHTGNAYTVLGFQLMTIAMGVETIGGSWTFQFGDISLTDMRWGTGSAYQTSVKCELKTRFNENYSIPPPVGEPPGHPGFPVPRLGGAIGYPNPLRPFQTYTYAPLEADINNNGAVDIFDLIVVSNKFGATETQGGQYWDYACDIIKDGVIDIYDLIKIGDYFGETGTYQTGLGTIEIYMQEVDNYGGIYWPDPPPGYTGPPWNQFRSTPYTCHLYLETWDVIDWPNYVSRTINWNPCINYMGYCDVFNGTTLSQVGACFYAFDYPIHD